MNDAPSDFAEADTVASVLAALERREARTERVLADLLRIPSVSAQPAHAGDCARAADALAAELASLGFAVAIDQTPGRPIVRATHPGTGRAGAPHVLYYGHYDVQPAEPLGPWTTPPFEPRVVDGPHGRRLVGRGAVDDKGQVMTWLAALAAWHEAAGGPPCPVTVIVEGEEETGSTNLEPYLAARAAGLGCDVAVISDTGMWDVDTPAITTRLRGLAYVELTIAGAAADLHSGMYGGAALNPLNTIARILGALHDDAGRVAIPGFYDGIADPSPAILDAWRALGFDEAAFLGAIGLRQPVGERDRIGLERLWSRPTADINGLWGGYQGDGSKTVIAREAHAKISFRLVPGQDPDAVVAGFERFVRDRLPGDATARFLHHGAAPGTALNTDGAFMRAARLGLAEEYGRDAVLIGCGGSIPVVETMQRVLGIDSLMVGFGLADDGMHGPDEKFELVCLHRGARAHARILAHLAAAAGRGAG